jgi:hypothetical protein
MGCGVRPVSGCAAASVADPLFETNGYHFDMSTVELRRKIKRQVDLLPPKRLESLADYIQFLNRPPVTERVAAAEKAIAAGKGVNWRKARSDV